MTLDQEDIQSSPVAESLLWCFRFAFTVVTILAVAWFTSGISALQAGQQAVVTRAGQVVRVETEPGLIISLPEPIQQVHLLPSPNRRLQLPVLGFAGNFDISIDADQPTGITEASQALAAHGQATQAQSERTFGYGITADLAMVHADPEIIYSIVDAEKHLFQHAAPLAALERIARQAIIKRIAIHRLDDILIYNKQAILEEIVVEIERQADSAHLGVQIHRLDCTFMLPPLVQKQFNEAQSALAEAGRRSAQARSDATVTRRRARTKAASIQHEAAAEADEILSTARQRNAPIQALITQAQGRHRQSVFAIAQQEHLKIILNNVGKMLFIHPDESIRLRTPVH